MMYWKVVYKTFLCLLVMYLFVVTLLYFMQTKLMYWPANFKPDAKVQGIPQLEEIKVTTSDGLTLYGWYKPPFTSEMPTIVWFHGNSSNVVYTTSEAIPYMTKGYGLLAVEYRGYGGNPGIPTEQGIYNDARAFMEWLNAEGTPANKTIIYGQSIGSGPAVQMATEYNVQTLILHSAFSSAIDAASVHYPYFPVKWLLQDKYENILKIEKTRSPLIMVHGDKDSVIPYNLGNKLFEKAPQPKTFITIEGGNHNNLYDFKVHEKILSALSE